jgi:hypothetical protein
MKFTKLVVFAAFVAVTVAVRVVMSAIESSVVSGSAFYRGNTTVVSGLFSPGETILFTNCVAYSDASGTIQDLTGATGTVRVVGSQTVDGTNSLYTNSITVTIDSGKETNGVFWFEMTLTNTASAGPKFQVNFTDGTNTSYYPPSRIGLIEML